MKVYVLAPIHNRIKETQKFLRSFSNQTYSNYQIIIVDDGSTDGSEEIIRNEFPKVIILKGDGNLWWTGSMNKGVKYILSVSKKDDYILAINDDVTVKNNYIEKLVHLNKINNNAIIGSFYQNITNNKIVYDSGVKIDWNNYSYYQVKPNINKKSTYSVDTLATRGTLIPISVIKNIGLFEKKLRQYGADYEFFLRAKKNGYKLLISQETVVYGSEINTNESDPSRIQSIKTIWNRNFGIKSAMNIYNHLYIIWHYCPSLLLKVKNSTVLVLYNELLFFNSIFIYPFKYVMGKISKWK